MPFFNFSFGKDKISKPDFVTPSQQKAINVTAAAFQWLDANSVPQPFKLNVATGCKLMVVLWGDQDATDSKKVLTWFHEGDNAKAVYKVLVDAGNTLLGATAGDINAWR